MKKISLILVFLGVVFTAQAQNDFLEKKPISVGYFGHYYFHPGIKIGTQYDWRSWEKRKEKKKKTVVKNKSLFISPQVGFYTHPKNHSGLLFNADFGYQRVKEKHGFYQAYSIGLGYLTQFNAGTTYVSEDDGSITTKKWASRAYFMPSLNMELGQQINEKMAWYAKGTIGSKLFYNTGVSIDTFLELGMKFNLGKF
jgi:hypothetical protein